MVGLNRRLPREMALLGQPRWEVTVVAPEFYSGANDLRSIALEQLPGEPYRLVSVRTRLRRWMYCFFYGRSLRRLLREDRWDFIHCWEEPYIVASGEIFSAPSPSVPIAFYTMQNIPKRYPPPFSWIERFCLRRATGWIAVGETTRQNQLQRGYGIRPNRVIPLGVALDLFRPDPLAKAACRRRLGWAPEGSPVIGFLGRFAAEKGLVVLTDALDGLKSDWRALFVGGGPLAADLKQWAARYGDRVRVLSPVPHDEVPGFLNCMDILAAPSQTRKNWREQQGRMLIEAFACGVPVIGSDSGDIPFVLADAGVICPEADVPAWQETIGRLVDNSSLRKEHARRGLDRAHTVYAWPLIAREHLDFFEQLLSAGTTPG